MNLTPASRNPSGGPIAEPHLRDFQALAQRIARDFPPDRYFYVGVGRGPTPVTAFLRQLHPGDLVEVPVSGLRYRQGQASFARQVPGAIDGSEASVLKAQVQANLHQRLLDHLPTDRELAGRALLLLDYFQTGETLLFLEREIRLAFKGARRHSPRVEACALGEGARNFYGLKAPLPSWFHPVPLVEVADQDDWRRGSRLETCFYYSEWRHVARFGKAPIDDPQKPRLQAKHLLLREQVRRYLAGR